MPAPTRTLAAAETTTDLAHLRTALGRNSALAVVAGVVRPSELGRAVREHRPDLVYVRDTVTGGRWAEAVDALPPGVTVVAVGLGRTGSTPGAPERSGYSARLAVPVGRGIEIVRVADVDYVEGAGGYVRVHARGRALPLREGLADVAARLDPARFVRIHRSVVVNVDRVRALRPCGRGEYVVVLGDGMELKLTRTYRDRLRTLLGAAHR